jgi:hypothetical protein
LLGGSINLEVDGIVNSRTRKRLARGRYIQFDPFLFIRRFQN